MLEIIECIQGEESWFRARMGIPTASKFATVMRSKGKGEDGKSVTRQKYMDQLAGEIITGQLVEPYTNVHLERGKEMEADARLHYAFVEDRVPQLVGFVRNGNKGASPDSFIDGDGMLEIKTALPDILIDTIRRDVFPTQHYAQCQGGLWVCEREWIDLIVYWPGMPYFVKRAYRDETYIKKMAAEVDRFVDELYDLVEWLRRYECRKTVMEDLSASVRLLEDVR